MRLTFVFVCMLHQESKIPGIDCIEDEVECLLEFNMRKRLRSKYAGARALEYKSDTQVVLEVLLDKNHQAQAGANVIFGKVELYGDSCEEQSRFILHFISHYG